MPHQNAEAGYIPNMGIRDFMIAPIDLNFLYQDTQDKPLPISLLTKHIDEYISTPTSPVSPSSSSPSSTKSSPNLFLPPTRSIVPPSSRHWCIVWEVKRTLGKPEPDTRAFRTLHLVRERDRLGNPCLHLTNWGPLTKVFPTSTIHNQFKFVSLGNLGLEGRKNLEEIAKRVKVKVPDREGKWGSQEWVMEVLREAVRERLMDVDLEGVRKLALQP